MKFSQIVNEVEPSLTRHLFNMAQEFDDVIDLTLGDPDLEAPAELKRAACEAINDNKTHYSANAGLANLREIITGRVNDTYENLNCDKSNIILTVGGMEALYLSLLTMLDEGDEVLIFAPYYVNYIQMVKMCKATPIIVDAYDKGFHIDKETLQSFVSPKTVAIIINSPNNPTGDVLSYGVLKTVADVAKENDLYVIADEVYKSLVFDGEFISIAELIDTPKRLVIIDSMSKEYSMTGWRIGYAYANSEFIAAMTKLQENIVACAPLPSQYAMIRAYEDNVKNNYIVDEFRKRRNFICEKLDEIDKFSYFKPKGTFYVFVDISQTGMKSLDFSRKLLEEKHVAVAPGISYGENYDKYIRIAFTKKNHVLEIAMKRISDFVNSL